MKKIITAIYYTMLLSFAICIPLSAHAKTKISTPTKVRVRSNESKRLKVSCGLFLCTKSSAEMGVIMEKKSECEGKIQTLYQKPSLYSGKGEESVWKMGEGQSVDRGDSRLSVH